ncbi:class I SAM-dependent methyltransferase [Candidatus Kaiserbacteria bacterium]|nr:class I SAM-dependent methyltransferase [Candidatus Kaiserbacteria bacterium]
MPGKSGFDGGQIGTEYDLLLMAIPHYNEVQEEVARLVATHANNRPISILEIGCGTGLTTRALLQHVPNVHITAVDKYSTMLDQAKNALRGHKNVTFVEADACYFLARQDDISFDAVVTVFCLHNEDSPYRRNAFREIGRIVRQGGFVVSADKIAQDDPVQHQASFDAQMEALAVFRGTPHWELEEEWRAHYLEDNGRRFIESEQVFLLTKEAHCHEVKRHRRWGMEALYTGIRHGNDRH